MSVPYIYVVCRAKAVMKQNHDQAICDLIFDGNGAVNTILGSKIVSFSCLSLQLGLVYFFQHISLFSHGQ